MYYSVATPNGNNQVFNDRFEAIKHCVSNHGSYLRQFKCPNNAHKFINSPTQTSNNNSNVNIHLSFCTLIKINVFENKFKIVCMSTNEQITQRNGEFPPIIKTKAIGIITIISQMIDAIEGNIKIMCNDPILECMYNDRDSWINYSAQDCGEYSHFISQIFTKMKSRKIELYNKFPFGTRF